MSYYLCGIRDIDLRRIVMKNFIKCESFFDSNEVFRTTFLQEIIDNSSIIKYE